MSSGQKQYNVPNQPSKPGQSGGPVVGGTHVFNAGVGVGATIMSGPFAPMTEAPLACPKCGSENVLGTAKFRSEYMCKRCHTTFTVDGGVACTLDDEEQKKDQGALKGMFTERK